MKKRWIVKPPSNEEEVQQFSLELNHLDETITHLLLQRGINSFNKAKSFFRPSLEELHDPFLMKNMQKAVDRLQYAIEHQQKILIYGDYDVDGTTSVALVYAYLKNFYTHLSYYIPDRYTEGYGVSLQGIDYASENGIDLIIALDCGIKAIDKVEYAKQKEIDFIICDHHRPGENIPNAVAVLDQKQEDCNYPYKELSGCGIGFKLMQAWTRQIEKDEKLLFQYLDLVAISTCADIVPITGENRVLVKYGLEQLNKSPRLGIQSMIKLSSIKKKLTATDLVFVLAPRINAAGRIKSGNKAVEILVAANKEEAEVLGKNINLLNTERKDIDRKITEQALSIINEDTLFDHKTTTVLFQKNWHKGVIGIVASRLIETHYRPTIILTESNGKATGSARSIKGFDVYNAIDACSDLLEQFGGHKYAAGLTMSIENVPTFAEKFEEVVQSQIKADLLVPQITIDAALNLNQITEKFYKLLKQFAPYGPGNMRPVFITKNVLSTHNSRVVGEHHLKLEVFPEDNPHLKMKGIAFNLGYKLDELDEGVPFSIVYIIEENVWNGVTSLQLNVKDIQLS